MTHCLDDRCQLPADVVDAYQENSTSGWLWHEIVVCVNRHRYHRISPAYTD